MLFWCRLYPFQRWLPGKFSCGRLPGSVWLGSPQNPRSNPWKFIWRPPLPPAHNRWTHVKMFVFDGLILLASIVHQMEESLAFSRMEQRNNWILRMIKMTSFSLYCCAWLNFRGISTSGSDLRCTTVLLLFCGQDENSKVSLEVYTEPF